MIDVINVANFFIDIAARNENSEYMTPLRIQKILYLAQGWFLARHHKPLFPERIEAWKYGPVVPVVYEHLKPYGRGQITEPDKWYKASVFMQVEAELLTDILAEYDLFSTGCLVSLTHETTPWLNHSINREEIPVAEIEAYFSALQPSLPDSSDLFEWLPIDVGVPTENGYRLYKNV
jgi:uncharacterized phage-associated protein